MKNTLLSSLLLGGGLLLPAVTTQAKTNSTEAKDAKKPNVLFIFVDDMTYDGLNALNNPEIISPNMDRIVKGGVNFVNNYNMGGWNGAISQASRSQLITGKYLWNCHENDKDKFRSEIKENQMWPQIMKQNGYKTFETGKWHMTRVTPKMLFDEVKDPRPGMPGDTPEGYNRPLSRQDTLWQPWDKSKGGYWKGGKHWSEVLADNAINYLEANKDSDKPLFMYCAFNAPHDPRQAPKKYVDMYPVDKIKVPSNFIPLHPYAEPLHCGKKLRDERLAPFPRTEYSVQKNRQEYYALITHLDDQVGRILKKLKECGMDKNTLIVFGADNGLGLGHHGLIGKQSMYDHSMKIPLVFNGLNLPKGKTRTQMSYLQDLVPTIYDIIGIPQPSKMEFQSLLPVIKNGRHEGIRNGIYGAYLECQRMIRDDRYKLFFIPEAHKVMLFDLKNDPMEVHDLFGQKKYDAKVKELATLYLKLAKESGDKFDLASIYPNVFKGVEAAQ